MKNDPIAELISDCHWSHSPPVLRSKEGSWYSVQKEYMQQIESFRPSLTAPIVCAGDVFHKSGAPPHVEPAEFINFILENMPEMYAVPGQHDLPNHRYDDLHRSMFWTMVKCRRIIPIEPGKPLLVHVSGELDRLVLHGFPYGYDITPCPKHTKQELHLAVVHSYIWMNNYGYSNAPPSCRVKGYLKKLEGYDAAVFGDNHNGFLFHGKKLDILNNGTVMRRRSDEIPFTPSAGILYESGKIVRKYLNVSGDRLLDENGLAKMAETVNMNMDEFVASVEELTEKGVDLRQAIKQYCEINSVKKSVRRLLMGSLDYD